MSRPISKLENTDTHTVDTRTCLASGGKIEAEVIVKIT